MVDMTAIVRVPFVQYSIIALDYLVAFILSVLFFTISLPYIVVIYFNGAWKNDNKPDKVIFFSFEGYKVAPTRIRCYHFCEGIKQHNIDAKVYAYWDRFFNLSRLPFPYRRVLESEKILMNIITFFKLLPEGKIIIYEQRPNYTFIVPILLRIINGTRIIIDIDDWIYDYRVIGLFRVKHLIKFMSGFCDCCIVSSHHLMAEMSKYFDRVYMIPTYVDETSFSNTSRNSNGDIFKMTWIGTIFQDFTYDNVLFLIRSFIKACDRIGDYGELHLDIIGDGYYYYKLEEYVKVRYSDYNIYFKGWLHPSKMPEYLRTIDVGLYSLLQPSDFHESKSPTKVFEYMACGIPVIATPLGEVRYFLKDGEAGFLASNIDQFSNCMIQLYSDSEMRKRMGEAGRRAIEEKYNLGVASSELASILSELM